MFWKTYEYNASTSQEPQISGQGDKKTVGNVVMVNDEKGVVLVFSFAIGVRIFLLRCVKHSIGQVSFMHYVELKASSYMVEDNLDWIRMRWSTYNEGQQNCFWMELQAGALIAGQSSSSIVVSTRLLKYSPAVHVFSRKWPGKFYRSIGLSFMLTVMVRLVPKVLYVPRKLENKETRCMICSMKVERCLYLLGSVNVL